MTFMNAAERDRYEEQPLVCGLYQPLTHEREISGFCTGQLERQWPAPSFKLVGAGFHDNDYPKK
jgi:hypothetical protein